ncbi:MAG: hypothetical protein CM1200mP24_09370 [Gammaproteobacteria bacterium]|nr:MAG: hypothetical protein CM1200mP24_09370 [Gammaproteobacteria bacterium]
MNNYPKTSSEYGVLDSIGDRLEYADRFHASARGTRDLLSMMRPPRKVIMRFDVAPEFCYFEGREVQRGYSAAWIDAAMAQLVSRVTSGEKCCCYIRDEVELYSACCR